MTQPDRRPICSAEFDGLMAALGPYENRPCVAVACSGGPDSMALAALMQDWAAARQGTATALTVDHGIRPNSRDEAAQVAGFCRGLGIPHIILRYEGPQISRGVQASAREIRYALLSDWCATNGVLHLAVAHHREDQAETVLMRLARGSGVDGLAGMAPVTETRQLRIVRPLLYLPRHRLHETLRQRDIPSVADPSNDDTAFARVRMRALGGVLSAEGLTASRLAATAARNARARTALEGEVAGVLARAAIIHPLGFAYLDTEPFCVAPQEIALRALSRLTMCLGGRNYPPRLTHLERLYDWIMQGTAGGGRTLAGTRIVPRGERLLICREVSAATETLPARGEVFWDGRFRLRFGVRGTGDVRRLGCEGWRQATAAMPALRRAPIPAAARFALPSVWSSDTLTAIPQLGLAKRKPSSGSMRQIPICFAPRQPLIPACFTL